MPPRQGATAGSPLLPYDPLDDIPVTLRCLFLVRAQVDDAFHLLIVYLVAADSLNDLQVFPYLGEHGLGLFVLVPVRHRQRGAVIKERDPNARSPSGPFNSMCRNRSFASSTLIF
jgi:hypothetical protein